MAPEKWVGYQKVYSGGMSIISTTTTYMEGHMIHVVAYDSAGNETKTDPIRIEVKHKEKEKKDEEGSDQSQGYLLPPIYREKAPFAWQRRVISYERFG